MEQSYFWEANRSPDSQEIPHILWNPKGHYCIHKHLPPVPILSGICPFHASPSDSLKIHFNIILPSMPSSSQWSVLLTSFHQNPVCTSSDRCICHMPLPSLSSWFNHPNDSWWRAQIISYALCCLLHSPLILSLVDPDIFVRTLFSARIPTTMWETEFHIHTKVQAKL